MKQVKHSPGNKKRVKTSLSEDELRYKVLSESAPLGIFSTDASGYTNYVSQRWCEISGIGFAEALGDGWLKAVHPDDRKKMEDEWKEAVRKKKTSGADYRFMHDNGSVTWVRGLAAPQIDADGNIAGFIGTIIDITELKAKEEAVIEKEERYRALFEGANDAILIMEGERFIDCNQMAVNMYGCKTKSEMLNHYPWEFSPPRQPDGRDSREKAAEHIDAAYRGVPQRFYWKHTRLSGEEFDAGISLNRIALGNNSFIQALVRDISEQKTAENKLIESEAYYRALVDLSPEGILTADVNGMVTYGSRRAYEIFGEPEDGTAIGKSVFYWVEPGYHDILKKRFQEIIAGSTELRTGEFKLLKHDRSVFWAEMSSSPIVDANGKISGLLIVCRDITERKIADMELLEAKEKAEESDRLKTAFLHNISHEIRTPMNAIIGFSSLLSEPDLTDETRRPFVDHIMDSSNHLLAIVNDIMEISNIEAGILKINESSININSLLNKLYTRFISKASKKGLQLNYSTTLFRENAEIKTDSAKLTDILSNLLDNALKFTDKGRIDYGYNLKKDFLEFYISDTGIGIPRNQHERVFDRFYQLDNSKARVHEGTGLGLSICKGYVEFLGGKIWVSSEEQRGSTFSFTLPYIKAAEGHEKADRQEHSGKPAFAEDKTILIAEDEENNYLLMVEYLSKLNMKTIWATDGVKAVDLFRTSGKIDLVLMDIRLPEMDGYSAAKEIKAMDPRVPVIAQSAYEFDKSQALKSGCSDFMSKPFTREELIQIVQKYIIQVSR